MVAVMERRDKSRDVDPFSFGYSYFALGFLVSVWWGVFVVVGVIFGCCLFSFASTACNHSASFLSELSHGVHAVPASVGFLTSHKFLL